MRRIKFCKEGGWREGRRLRWVEVLVCLEVLRKESVLYVLKIVRWFVCS